MNVAVLGSSASAHRRALASTPGVHVVAPPVAPPADLDPVARVREAEACVLGVDLGGWEAAVEPWLRGGKRVLLIAPYAIASPSLAFLRRIAGDTPGLLSLSMPCRADPALVVAARALRDGEIGRPRCARVLWSLAQPAMADQASGIIAWAGALAGLGLFLLDEAPARVAATVAVRGRRASCLALNVEGTGGGLALLAGHPPATSAPQLRELWVIGERGALQHNGDGGDLRWHDGRASRSAPPHDPVAQEVAQWLRATRGAGALASLDDFVRARAVAFAAVASLERREPVSVDTAESR